MVKKVLLTGANGFLGSNFIEKIISLSLDIAVLKHNSDLNLPSEVKIFSSDLSLSSSDIIKFSPNYIYHFAGVSTYQVSSEDRYRLWESNVIFGSQLIDVIKELPNVVFVNFDTSLAYSSQLLKPYNFYALTKSIFTKSLYYYSSWYKLNVFNLILYNVYGPGDKNKRIMNYIIDSIDSSKTVDLSPGLQQLDFIHVDDVISLCIKLLNEFPINQIEDIHVGTGIGTNLFQIKELVENLSGKSCNINFGGIPYRNDEKMINIAPDLTHRFWKYKIDLELGIKSLFFD